METSQIMVSYFEFKRSDLLHNLDSLVFPVRRAKKHNQDAVPTIIMYDSCCVNTLCVKIRLMNDLFSVSKPGDACDKTSKDDECPICLSDFTNKKTLDKCGHSFCTKCIDKAFSDKKRCPVCGVVYGLLMGNQPPGKMFVSHTSINLPGYESCGCITITYQFEDGVQGQEHPTPGKRFSGIIRSAYLPDNETGRKVLRLLQKAFEQRLTFTIGLSTTTGVDNAITWNDIPHKTSILGGPSMYVSSNVFSLKE